MKRIIINSDKRIISHFQINYNSIIVIQNENANITTYNYNNNGKLTDDYSTISDTTIHQTLILSNSMDLEWSSLLFFFLNK